MNRKEAAKIFEKYIGNECYKDTFQEACKLAIAALQEPERKKGRWIGDFGNSEYDDWRCSNCGKYYPERNKKRLGDYCQWCGADMRGRQN